MKFEELVKKFSPKIKRLANRTFIPSKVINKDDLYQEMLSHLWERWRKGELGDKTDSYIIGSCYFHIKNYLRRFKEKTKLISLNEPLGEEGLSLEELIPSQTPLFEEKVDDILFIRKMKKKELNRREKEVADVEVLDAKALDMTYDEMIDKVKEIKPDVCIFGDLLHSTGGLSVIWHFNETAKKIKEVLPEVKNLMGGLWYSAYSTETLEENPGIDFIAMGEGELTITDVVNATVV